VRLPGEASPAKEAKDGQHNNDDDDDPKNRHVILSLGACRLYGEPTRICKVRGLRREWNGSRSGERGCERGEDAEVGVKRDPFKPTDAERKQAPLMLKPAALTLGRMVAAVRSPTGHS